MNKLALIPITLAAMAAFSNPAHADSLPTVNAHIDCTSFKIHVEGLQLGDRLVVEQGSQAPYGFEMGSGVYWQFDVTPDGTADATFATTTDPWFTADVGVVRDGQFVILFHQMVDCDGTAPAVDPTIQAAPTPSTVAAAPVVRERRIMDRLLRFGLR